MVVSYLDIVRTRNNNPCATLKQIGTKYHITRERVRQILKEQGAPTRAIIVKPMVECLNCGTPTTKNEFCSPECRHDYQNIKVACEVCGTFKEYRVSWLNYMIAKKGHEHYFCSKECQGKWLGTNYGRPREKDHAWILELAFNHTHPRDIALQTGRDRQAVSSILCEYRKRGIPVPKFNRYGIAK